MKRKRVSFVEGEDEHVDAYRESRNVARRVFCACMDMPKREVLTPDVATDLLRDIKDLDLIALYARRILDVSKTDTKEIVWHAKDAKKNPGVTMQVKYSPLTRERAQVLLHTIVTKSLAGLA